MHCIRLSNREWGKREGKGKRETRGRRREKREKERGDRGRLREGGKILLIAGWCII